MTTALQEPLLRGMAGYLRKHILCCNIMFRKGRVNASAGPSRTGDCSQHRILCFSAFDFCEPKSRHRCPTAVITVRTEGADPIAVVETHRSPGAAGRRTMVNLTPPDTLDLVVQLVAEEINRLRQQRHRRDVATTTMLLTDLHRTTIYGKSWQDGGSGG